MKRQNLLYIGVFIAAISISAVATQLVGDFGRVHLPQFNLLPKRERGDRRHKHDLRSDAARNIDRLLADDQKFGIQHSRNIANGMDKKEALDLLVSQMRSIDTDGVPADVVELYKVHTDAWENSLDKKIDDGEENVVNTTFYALERRAQFYGAMFQQ